MGYIRGLLFDKDGTLFDFHHTWSVWCHHLILDLTQSDKDRAAALADALDFDLNAVAFRPNSPVIAGTLEELVSAALSVLPERSAEELRQGIIDTSAQAVMSPAVPLPPLLDTFRAMDIALGVATNDAEHPARVQLRAEGIHDHFDYIAGYDTGHGAKPDPGMLLAFCEDTGLAPAQVAMIGDSTHDLHAGRAAGMVCVGVLTGPAKHDDLAPHADAVLPDIGHLGDWLATFKPTKLA